MSRHDVVIVGAGLAGLSAALDLSRDGLDVRVLEASDAVGGRIRTDTLDGMLLDRGFQLLNPAYPALSGYVDLDALDLCPFSAGVVVATEDGRAVLADPRRAPRHVLGAVDPGTGGPLEKTRLATYLAGVSIRDADRLKSRPDMPYGAALDRARVGGRVRDRVLRPFLAGVLGEEDESTSRRFVDLLLRAFARGTPSLPTDGMQALPQQLADRLPDGVVSLGAAADRVAPGLVSAGGESFEAPAVVVATDAPNAHHLTGVPTPPMRALTTYYHWLEASPADLPMLHLDGARRGPIVNTAVVSDIARSYCRQGALVASTVVGARDDAETRAAVEGQLRSVYPHAEGDLLPVATYAIEAALPAMLPPLDLRRPVELGDGLYVCGDHRDTASIQGAIVSGRRTARAVRRDLRR